jgi:hypothetical protein
MIRFAILISILIAAFIVYTPWVGRNFFGTRWLNPIFWLPAIPFAIFIFIYDEIRKLLIRDFHDGFLKRVAVW